MIAYRPNQIQPVYGVNGFWGSLGSGLQSFAQSGLGQAILTVGTTLGTAALTQELFGNKPPQQAQQVQSGQPTYQQYIPSGTQPAYVNPTYAPLNPAAGGNIYANLAPGNNVPAQGNVSATAPTWLVPVALGAIALMIVLRARK